MGKLKLIKDIQLDAALDTTINTFERFSNYFLIGNITLTGNTDVALIGSVEEGTKINVYYNGDVTVNGFILSLFGTDISQYALQKIKIECIYLGGVWNYNFSNFNTFELTVDSIDNSMIKDNAISTGKVMERAIKPSRLESKNEVVPIRIDLNKDSKSSRSVIPFKGVLQKVSYYCVESFNTTSNNIEFNINIDGNSTSTAYQLELVGVGNTLVEGDSGTISTTPSQGTDLVGSFPTNYVEINLKQTSNQGGSIMFFLIIRREDI